MTEYRYTEINNPKGVGEMLVWYPQACLSLGNIKDGRALSDGARLNPAKRETFYTFQIQRLSFFFDSPSIKVRGWGIRHERESKLNY